MTAVKFDHKLLWVRNGAGPELDCPHTLFEARLQDEQGWTIDQAISAHLLRILHLDASADDLLAFEENDIFSAFAVFAILLQRRAGIEVSRFVVIRQSGTTARVAVSHIWPPAVRMAADLAAQFVEIVCGKFAVRDERVVETLLDFENACTAGPRIDHRHLYLEAIRRGIPAVLRPPFDLILGHGRNRRYLYRILTDRTSHLAERLATNKTQTLEALRNAGLPVPHHLAVADVAEARKAAERIGFPVVVKPVSTDRGVGITVDIRSIAELEQAYRHARTFGTHVAVEKFIPGETFRLLVVGGKFIAAACTQPTPVIGDGKSTVRELVARINMSPMRGSGIQKPLSRIEIDDEALAILSSLSLTPDSVLPFGRTIRLRTASNLSRGGQSVSVTDRVHPDNRKLAEACTQIVGLDLSGIDFRSDAIEASWRDGHGAVIEVNPSPGLRMHIHPAKGPAADVGTPILDLLFPDPAKSRIPIVAVTGTNGKTTTTRLIDHILKSAGLVTGVATTEEAMIDGRIVFRGDCAGAPFSNRILGVPTVEAAVLETARGGIIEYGLGFDRCSVAVVTNVAADHLGQDGIETVEGIAAVKLTVPRSAETAVLNADNSHCLAMRGALGGRRIILFSLDTENPAIREHMAGGGTAYVLDRSGGREVILRMEGDQSTPLIDIAELPITFGGSARHNIENALAALAAVHGLGMSDQTACEGARSFRTDYASNPGRLNEITGLGFDLILDYAHNKHGFEAMARFLSKRPRKGRALCVVSMPGGRVSDEMAWDAMTALAGHFDHYVTANDDAAKHRREGFPGVLQKGLIAAGVRDDLITVRDNLDDALDEALALARPDDLVMMLGGQEPEMLQRRLQALAARAKVQASP